MEITCTQENLNRGLSIVSHAAAKSGSLPILSHVLIQAQDGVIKLAATNLELGISCAIRGKVEKEGEYTVPSRLLADYVSLLPKGQVVLAVASGAEGVVGLEVRAEQSSTMIKGLPSSEFPLIPQVERREPYRVEAEGLRQLIGQVVFAVSTSETRPEINGVYLRAADGKLTAAATDSYRLAERQVALAGGPSAEQEAIVPARTLQELQRVLASNRDPADIAEHELVEFSLAGNQASFNFSGVELVSRLVEGKYPDYQQIIPQQAACHAVVSVAELVAATKAASLFSRLGIYDTKLQLQPEQQRLTLSSANAQLGQSTTEVGAKLKGDGMEIVLNYRYLLDGLQNLGSEEVVVEASDAGSPCLLKPADGEGGYLYIIMPIKQ